MIFAMRLLAELLTQTTADPSCTFDSDVEVAGGLKLTDFLDQQKRFQIGPAEADTPIAIPDCLALIVFSDNPVNMRLTGGEVLMPNGVLWAMQAGDESTAILPARSLLFSGNGINTSTVFVWAIEKP